LFLLFFSSFRCFYVFFIRLAFYFCRRDGRKEILTGTGRAELDVGDVFVIETPGGGGYGSASDD